MTNRGMPIAMPFHAIPNIHTTAVRGLIEGKPYNNLQNKMLNYAVFIYTYLNTMQ